MELHRADWVQPLLDWSAEHLAPGVQVSFIIISYICFHHYIYASDFLSRT